MSEIALYGKARRQAPRADAWRRLVQACGQALLGLAEGFAAAKRYRRLTGLSDAALAQRGMTREDLPRVALFGERRPR